VKVKPHDSRRSKNGVSGPSSDGYLRIITNNLDVPAEVIAALYELRWTVEVYQPDCTSSARLYQLAA